MRESQSPEATRRHRSVESFYADVKTDPDLNERMRVTLEEYRRFREARARPLRLLDVGCGRNALYMRHVDPTDEYCGCDIIPPHVDVPCFEVVDLNTERLADKFDGQFDVVFCGEVIEHVFSPDTLIADLKAVLAPNGLLLLSTPNLAYWVNRLLLLVGINPLFVENSANVKLGRRTQLLGQGAETQGHLHLFTYRAMRDFIGLHDLELVGLRAVQVWEWPVDRLICRLSRSLAPDIIYLLRNRA
jgi:SAM-dependent methyltransferase